MTRRFNKIINSSRPVLVDFYADWCIPCKQIPPILKEVKDHFQNNIRIIKVNVDHYPDIANNYKINNLPAIVLFQRGQVHWASTGVVPVNDITLALVHIL
ncbi:MAG TPA: thioredoxin [Prolixibacteraceae bacterium]|jgi:thioredoxin 1|nr:thioredoxin [Prolixibacteraceae bacterium]